LLQSVSRRRRTSHVVEASSSPPHHVPLTEFGWGGWYHGSKVFD